jgi:hypothetical protein
MRGATDVLNDLGSLIYSPSFENYRSSGALRDVGIPLNAVALVLDFESEVTCSGIVDFLGNSTGAFARETVDALRQLNCLGEAEALLQIVEIAEAAGMTREAVQLDLSHLEPFTVGTFAEFHGDKWNRACDEIQVLSVQINLEHVVNALESFVEANRSALEADLELFGVQRS